MDGYELVRRLREAWNDRPVRFVAITGYGQEPDKDRAKAFGFDAHLVKPIDLDKLAALSSNIATPVRPNHVHGAISTTPSAGPIVTWVMRVPSRRS